MAASCITTRFTHNCKISAEKNRRITSFKLGNLLVEEGEVPNPQFGERDGL